MKHFGFLRMNYVEQEGGSLGRHSGTCWIPNPASSILITPEDENVPTKELRSRKHLKHNQYFKPAAAKAK